MTEFVLSDCSPYVYGPWGEEYPCPGGKCSMQDDPQGHRQFAAWDLSCPLHGLRPV